METNTENTNIEVTQLGAPTLTTQASGPHTINLTWTSITGATQYLIFRKLNSETNFSLLTSTSNTSYLDTNLTPNTAYFYRVIPFIVLIPGLPSNIASATTSSENNNNNNCCCCRCCSCCRCRRCCNRCCCFNNF